MSNTWNALLAVAVQASETAEEAANAAGAAGEAAKTVTETAKGVAAGDIMPWLLLVGIVLVLVVPLVLGTVLARWLKVPELSGRLGATLLALTLGASPFVVNAVKGVPFGIPKCNGSSSAPNALHFILRHFAVFIYSAAFWITNFTNSLLD